MLNNCLFIILIFFNNLGYFAILIDFSNSGMFFWKRLSQMTIVKAITVCSDMLKIEEYFLHFPQGVLVQVCKTFKKLKKNKIYLVMLVKLSKKNKIYLVILN